MISRRRIVTRSRDELNVDFGMEEDEDVWLQKDKLYRNFRVANDIREKIVSDMVKDHIQEVLNKWDQIDDEIWAKIICMERNRRIAKAYARAPVLTVNGSDDGFDGFRIGLNGFANPLRDAKTEEVKRHIGHGVKIKMDDAGNILVKRISKTNVFVKDVSSSEDNSICSEIIKMNGQLELEKPVKLFDMKKFQSNVGRELRRAYPDRRKLESQCISAISFVKDAAETLDCCCWIMIINIVALEMLKSKLPPIAKRQSAPNLISIFERPRMPDPEEDPYSLPTSTNSSSSRVYNGGFRDSKPPKLPPRDSERIPVPMPDYEDDKDENSKFPSVQSSRKKARGYDDPYYCGMKARVPNFGKKDKEPMKRSSSYFNMLRNQDRFPYDNVHEHDFPVEDEYGRIYGRFRTSPHPQMYHRREVFVGEWE